MSRTIKKVIDILVKRLMSRIDFKVVNILVKKVDTSNDQNGVKKVGVPDCQKGHQKG